MEMRRPSRKKRLLAAAFQFFRRGIASWTPAVLFLCMGPAFGQAVDGHDILFKSFTPGNESVELDGTSRIVVLNDDQELVDLLEAPLGLLSKLRSVTGLQLSLVVTMSGITSKDIVLSNTPDAALMARIAATTLQITAKGSEYMRTAGSSFVGPGRLRLNTQRPVRLTVEKNISINVAEEGFKYKVDDAGITLMFQGRMGAYRGIQSLMEILLQDGLTPGLHRNLLAGEGIDYPSYKKRVYMVDLGRKFVPVEQLIGWMESMSRRRINIFHMHINDDAKTPEGVSYGFFRLEHERAAFTPRDKTGVYTRQDWERLEDAAYRYGIKLLPEFDSPGHAGAWAQDIRASGGATERIKDKDNDVNIADLKTTDDYRAVNAQYIIDLISEYLDWFRGDSIHIGGDESTNTWSEDVKYMNLLYEGMKRLGFDTVNMWYDNSMVNGSKRPRWIVNDPDSYWVYPIADIHPDMEIYTWVSRDYGELVDRPWVAIDSYFVPQASGWDRDGTTFANVWNNYNYDHGRRPGWVSRGVIPNGFGGATWNDVTLRRRLSTDYINAGISRSFAGVGLFAWAGGNVETAARNKLIAASQEMMAIWVNDRFPYLSGAQAAAILEASARYRKISLGSTRDGDTLVSAKSEDWMAWDIEDMNNAFKGPTSFTSPGTHLVDQPGEGMPAADGRICRDGAFAIGERGISACDEDTWPEAISGAGGLLKQGAGKLRLAAANSFSGGIEFAGGQLEIGTAASLGTGPLSFSGGTLAFSRDTFLSKEIALSSAGGGLNAGGNNVSMLGVISGPGQLRIASESTTVETQVVQITIVKGARTTTTVDATMTVGYGSAPVAGGRVVLSGKNTFSGGLRLESGAVHVFNSGNLGAASNDLTFAGGTISFAVKFNLPASRDLILAGVGGIDTNGNDIEVQGAISGSGELVKAGAGALMLGGTTTYTGSTRVLAGTLVEDSSKIRGDLYSSAGAEVEFNQASSADFAGGIFGDGLMKKNGAGVLTLKKGSAANWQISAGGVVSEGEFGGDLAFVGSGSRSFEFRHSGISTYRGVMSGDGAVTLNGSGGSKVTVMADSSEFAGSFEVRAANTLYVVHNAELGGEINVKSGGELTGSGTMNNVNVEGGGSFRPVAVVTVNGDLMLAANSKYLVNLGYRTHVKGNADIGGSIMALSAVPPIEVETGDPDGGGAFVIMAVDGTRTGEFDSTVDTSGLPFVAARIVHDAEGRVRMAVGHNDAKLAEFIGQEVQDTNPVVIEPGTERQPDEVKVNVATEGDFQLPPGIILTQPKENSVNPSAMAKLFDDARADFSIELGGILDNAILNLSGDAEEMNQVMDGLAAEVHAAVKPVVMVANVDIQDMVASQMQAGMDADAAGSQNARQTRFSLSGKQWGLVDDEDGPVLWVKALHSLGKNSGADTFKDIKYNSTGMLIGSDAAVGENMRAGMFAGLRQMEFEQPQSNSKGSSNSSYTGVYGSWQLGRLLLRNGFNYSAHKTKSDRAAVVGNSVIRMSSNYSSHAFGLFTELGFLIEDQKTLFEPFIGLNYMQHTRGAFSEPEVGFYMPEKKSTMGAIRMGLQARTTDLDFLSNALDFLPSNLDFLSNMQLSGGLVWEVSLRNPDTAVVQAVGGYDSSARTKVSGVTIGGNSFTLQTGIAHSTAAGLDMQLNYSFAQSTQVSSNSRHVLEGKISYDF